LADKTRETSRGKLFKPTAKHRKTVYDLAAGGTPHEQIARVVVTGGMTVATLKKHFHEELATAGIQATGRVVRSLYDQALDGNTKAIDMWTRNRAKDQWGETTTTVVEIKTIERAVIRAEVTGGD